ncbi:hypothetical protein RDWZM_008928 [Blomia tropicalis]|uniref:Pecanex-like protein n=1 Tax=Blomia tropicalis TaxID=40697 RepID=A0A9Q0M266_BLOTA|nr:hypothetical protein RDWZM_008928 [Blomia tropicalis]
MGFQAMSILTEVIKLINAYFHLIFDTGKCIKDDVDSSDLDQQNGANDASSSRDQFEMTAMPTSSTDNNLQLMTIDNNIAKPVQQQSIDIDQTASANSSSANKLDEVCNDENDIAKRIDCKADVHCNGSNGSSCVNLSLLFRSNSSADEYSENDETQHKKSNNELIKSSLDIATSVNYSKANSSCNSIGLYRNNNLYEQIPNFRRARSELETTKQSRPTILVPPSHPVSLEIINSLKKPLADESGITLDTSRFNKSSSRQLSPFELPVKKSTSKQMKENEVPEIENSPPGGSFNLEKIDEHQERKDLGSNPVSNSNNSTYIKAFNSSEDGDESEVSLCTNESFKTPKNASVNRKVSKLPLRRTRFSSNNRKRMIKYSGVPRSDLIQHHESYVPAKDRTKSVSLVSKLNHENDLMSSSDEEERHNKHLHEDDCQRSTRLNRSNSNSSSDSSSFIPSSSSSIASLEMRTKLSLPINIRSNSGYDDRNNDDESFLFQNKTTNPETIPLNAPSTSTGISHLNRRRRHRSHCGSNTLECLRTRKLTMTATQIKEQLNLYKNDPELFRTLCILSYPTALERESHSRSNSLLRDSCDSKIPVSQVISSASPNSNIFAEILASPGTHLATSHEDTTAGSVHVFQDERGNWFSYTFDDNSTGLAKGICPLTPFTKHIDTGNDANSKISPNNNSKSNNNGSNALVPSNSIFFLNNNSSYPQSLSYDQNTIIINNLNNKEISKNYNSGHGRLSTSHVTDELDSPNHRSAVFFDPMPIFDTNFDPIPSFLLDASTTSDFLNSFPNHSLASHSYERSQQQLKQSQYYEMNVLNLKTFKIRFDRLALQAFLDRNITTSELIFSILLSISVSILSSQYTLLKSVQPDAASPTHGFNRITIYSRPIYFCLGCLLLLFIQYYLTNYQDNSLIFKLYGMNIFNRDLIQALFVISRMFLLSFPLLFTFGFLPQFNTFFMYVFEQIDIHIFGGTAMTMGIISAIYSLSRSILVVCILYLLGQLLNIKETQRATFSVFCGLLIAISYHISRLPSDPSLYWNSVCSIIHAIGRFFRRLFSIGNNSTLSHKNDLNESSEAHIVRIDVANMKNQQQTSPIKVVKSTNNVSPSSIDQTYTDPLPSILHKTTLNRLESDFIVCIFIVISVFGVHVSSIFLKLQPLMNNSLTAIAIIFGLILHYLMGHTRKQLPWLCFANPLLKSQEYKKFEVDSAAQNMWFEILQSWLWLIEKNVIYPLLFLSYITTDCSLLIKNYGPNLGVFLLVLCAFKAIRATLNDPSNNYIIITFTYLFFTQDFKRFNGSKDNIFLINYFFMSIIFHKVYDFLLKLRFVITYVAPWQITWGSAFHAFAQPFSVPHSAMLLVQVFISSILSSPLQPLLGSAIFLASYVRPIKFWERDYNTKRVDHSNTRLASQIDKAQIGSDDNNLNSIFYEHLTRSLQTSLYGDLILGRWGDVSQGDCFVLASDNLNCLVHIIELGNGLVTFQVRGLEFRGTYCQQREVEAISESVSDDEGCCCCEPGHVKGLLSINTAFNQRWLSWEVTHTNYILEGYSISENSASAILQPYDLRKALITYYVKSIIFYCVTSKSFIKWIQDGDLKKSLNYLEDQSFVDLDPTFNFNIDEDFDVMATGITRVNFKLIYNEWIQYCIEKDIQDASKQEIVRQNDEFVITLCMGLSLLARRALGTAAHHNSALMSVDFFLYGFHALFKGDFRVHCPRDEWVFQDMDFLNKVIAPSVRMSLKLHQEQFTSYDEHENSSSLFEAILKNQENIVISHEADPIWRNAILSNVPSLLALRHVFDDGIDQYKVIMLNKRFLNFRVIKVNRECVRGLWAGQQQELIFLRNRNPERGSIQNAKQVLRNIINSSCDQPIGYPIYVSPLTTSFAESSKPLCSIIGPSLSVSMFKRAICGFFQKIGNRCSEVCSSRDLANELAYASARLSKSESSDRGIDENVIKSGSLSSHHQLAQLTNYNQYLKKRALQHHQVNNDEECIPLNQKNLVAQLPTKSAYVLQTQTTHERLQNSQNSQFSDSSLTNNQKNNQSQSVLAETSFNVNIEQPKILIVDKGSTHSNGDSV